MVTCITLKYILSVHTTQVNKCSIYVINKRSMWAMCDDCQNAVLKCINLVHKWTLLEAWLSSSLLSFLCLSQATAYLAILVCTDSVWRLCHTVPAEGSHSQRSSRAHHSPLLSSCPHIHTAQSHWNSPHDTPHDLSSYWDRYLTWEEQKDTDKSMQQEISHLYW